MSWIKLTIAEMVHSNLSHLEITSYYWEHNLHRNLVKNCQRIQRIKVKLATCRQQGLSIEEYYGKLMQLWTSLSEFRQSKTCNCPVGINIEKECEEDRLHEFLQWLDKALCGSVKSSLLSKDPLPTLDEAYINVLLQDVDVKHTSCVRHNKNDTMAYSVRTYQNGGMTRSFP